MKNKTKIIALLLVAILSVSSLAGCSTPKTVEYKQVEMTCDINGESYNYSITYDADYKVIENTSDIEWFNENIKVDDYKDDALKLIAHIETTVREAGGTVNHYPIKTITK
jgi:uncharacterized lipoprotein YehR (DUF1307 family)